MFELRASVAAAFNCVWYTMKRHSETAATRMVLTPHGSRADGRTIEGGPGAKNLLQATDEGACVVECGICMVHCSAQESV